MEIDKMTPLEIENAEFDAKIAKIEAGEYDYESLFNLGEPKTAKNKAELKKFEAEWKIELEEMIAEAKFKADLKKIDDENNAKIRKIKNKQKDGLYNDITGKRIPYMNDEGDHIDYDHGWYDQ